MEARGMFLWKKSWLVAYRLHKEKWKITGKKTINLSVGISLVWLEIKYEHTKKLKSKIRNEFLNYISYDPMAL